MIFPNRCRVMLAQVRRRAMGAGACLEDEDTKDNH
jgi:hypothetical protein